MKIGILANEGSWYFRDLERAASSRGHECQRLDFTRLVSKITSQTEQFRMLMDQPEGGRGSKDFDRQKTPLRGSFQPDLILVRTMPPGSLEQVILRMDLLARVEASGVRIINSPKSLECAVDKYLTTARLQSAGLPVPDTIVCEHEDDAMSAFQDLGGDVVVKPLFGSEGRGIVRVSDPDLAQRAFRTLMRLDSVLYLQRFVNHGGFDVRIMVLDGKVIGGMRRISPHDFRTNVARQATAEPHEPTRQEIEYAVRSVSTTGAYVAGVDLLYDRVGGCYVIEVNAVPGWQAFSRVTGIDVADRLIDRLENAKEN